MLWKIITVIVFVLLLIFAYVTLRSKNSIPQSPEQAIGITNTFSDNFMADLGEATGNVAVIPDNFRELTPVVNEADLGELSPLYGKVVIEKNPWGPSSEDLYEEYVVLTTLESNTTNINITGWSLQSMIGNIRVYIQDGVEDVIINDINATYEIELIPGQQAIVSTSASPLGVSFQTNMCTGYLGQFQKFEPALERACPSPTIVFPPTITNIATYGGECVDFADTLNSCEYVTDEVLEYSNVNSVCVEHLRTALTYTTCRVAQKDSPEYFAEASWRIFLGQPVIIWNKSYEIIRLLDEKGRTVDVYAY